MSEHRRGAGSVTPGRESFWKRLGSNNLFWALLILALLLLFDLVFTPQFFRLQVRDGHLFGSMVDVFVRGAPLMIIAIGMTLVIATGGVDLSVGPVAAISAAVAASLVGGVTDQTNTPLPFVLAGALGVALLCGLWNGFLISRIGIQPIVATLILMVAGRGIAQLITDGQILTVYYEPFNFIGGGFLFLPFSTFIMAGAYLLAALLVRRTAFGMFVESIGVNANASHYSGINAKNVKLAVYAISGLCAGVAGILISSNLRSADANNAGLWFELDAILSVVIGGTSMAGGRFSLVGSFVGALIIQTLTTTIYTFGVPPEVTLVVKAIVVLAVSLIQSSDFRRLAAGSRTPPPTPATTTAAGDMAAAPLPK
jgi:simple sugar transport system permease protein